MRGHGRLPAVAGRGTRALLGLSVDLTSDIRAYTEAGWQWRGRESDHLLRVGMQYFNGKSSQYSFFDEHEELIGLGLWYDY